MIARTHNPTNKNALTVTTVTIIIARLMSGYFSETVIMGSESVALLRKLARAIVKNTPLGLTRNGDDLQHAINVVLVHAGVRRAARIDCGPHLLAAIRRSKAGLKVLDWSSIPGYEPLVVLASDVAAVAMTPQLSGPDHDAAMGRLLEYGCPMSDIPTSKCAMLSFEVCMQRVDATGHIVDPTGQLTRAWLAGFKCGKRKTHDAQLVARYTRKWVVPGNQLLAGTVVKVAPGTSFIIRAALLGCTYHSG